MAGRVRPGHAGRRDDGAMPEPTTYEIVIRGRASARLLRPLLDDFTIDHATDGVTRLVGDICDTSHLHGVLAHLTSVNAEVISVAPLQQPLAPETPRSTQP
jgi:hypothetical protein